MLDKKNESSKGNYICSLTQPANTRQINFEVTNMKYVWIKDEIESMEHVDCNTAIGMNFIIEYNIEEYSSV